jgi:hypothetical protein
MTKAARSPVQFDATLRMVHDRGVLRLPDAASKALPSRGQVAVHGTINGHPFETVLEPDGEFGHWMRVDAALRADAGLGASEQTNSGKLVLD